MEIPLPFLIIDARTKGIYKIGEVDITPAPKKKN